MAAQHQADMQSMIEKGHFAERQSRKLKALLLLPRDGSKSLAMQDGSPTLARILFWLHFP